MYIVEGVEWRSFERRIALQSHSLIPFSPMIYWSFAIRFRLATAKKVMILLLKPLCNNLVVLFTTHVSCKHLHPKRRTPSGVQDPDP